MFWQLEEAGCAMTVESGPSVTGALQVRLAFPDDEYLEKKCRRIVDEWRTDR